MKRKKSKKSIQKAPPIVFVPDKSYINDAGGMIPTDVILVSDPIMYEKISNILRGVKIQWASGVGEETLKDD